MLLNIYSHIIKINLTKGTMPLKVIQWITSSSTFSIVDIINGSKLIYHIVSDIDHSLGFIKVINVISKSHLVTFTCEVICTQNMDI